MAAPVSNMILKSYSLMKSFSCRTLMTNTFGAAVIVAIVPGLVAVEDDEALGIGGGGALSDAGDEYVHAEPFAVEEASHG